MNRLPFADLLSKPSQKPHNPPKQREIKALTIAAGFQCQEGFVLCADQQMSHGDASQAGSFANNDAKVFGCTGREFSAAICGAGIDGSYLRPAAERILRGLLSREREELDISPEQEEELERAYASGWQPPNWQLQQSQVVAEQLQELAQTLGVAANLLLLVAIVGTNGRFQFLKTDGLLVHHPKPTAEVLGIGETSLVYYLIDSLYRPDLTLKQMAALAVFVVAVGKKYCPQYCGGPTNVQILSLENHSLTALSAGRIASLEQVFWEDSPRSLHRVLNRAASLIE